MMLSFWDVVERCDQGERMEEGDYDLLLWKHVSELVKKYDIRFNPEQVIPNDDSLADRAFEAAMELFVRIGFYCLDTNRVVRFTRDEILGAMAQAPSS